MEYKQYKLEQIAKIKYGKNQSKVESEEGQYPIYGTGGLMGHSIKPLYDKPSVLIGRKGSISKVKYADSPFWTVDTLFYTIVDESIVLPKYLYYLLSTIDFDDFNEGTSIPSLRTETLYDLDLLLPSIDNQKKIVDLLTKYDKLIDNYDSSIGILSKIIRVYTDSIYCYNEFNKPDNWKIVPLSDIADFINGFSYTGSDLVDESIDALVSIKNFDRFGGFKSDGYKPMDVPDKVKTDQFVELFDVIVAHTDLTQEADVIGNVEMVLSKSKYEKIVMSMDLVKIKLKDKLYTNYLIAALLSGCNFKNHALGYVNGTTVLHLDKDALREYNLVVPSDEDIIQKTSFFVRDIYLSIAQIMKEKEKLIDVRETILNDVISGKIDISKYSIVDIQV